MVPIVNNCLTDCLLERTRGAHKRKHLLPPEVLLSEVRQDPPPAPRKTRNTGPPPGPVFPFRGRYGRSPWPTWCGVLRSGPHAPAGGVGADHRGGARRRRASPIGRSPASSSSTGSYDLFGENRPSMEVTRRAVRFASGWVQSQVQEAGRGRRGGAGREPAAVRPPAVRGAPRRRATARAGHHHALRPGEAAGRRARASTTSSPPATASGDGVYDGTLDGEFVWGQGKLRAIARVGDGARRVPRGELGLLGQLLRHPDAGRGRAPGRREPGPPPAWSSRSCAAGRWCTSTCPPACPSSRCVGIEPQQALLQLARPELIPYARFDITGVEHIPKEGAAIVVGNHRSYFDPHGDGPRAGQARSAGPLPRQEGGVRRADRRPAGQGHGRHPRRAGHRVGRAAGGGRPRPRGRGAGGDDAGGHHPAGTGLLRPDPQGSLGRGAPGGHDGCAGDPGRAVGHREGLAAQRAAPQHAGPPEPSDHHDPGGEGGGGAHGHVARRRHEEDHDGHHEAPARPRRARSARPPERSWPAPTRAARSRTPTRTPETWHATESSRSLQPREPSDRGGAVYIESW